jgi:hypothetical protein
MSGDLEQEYFADGMVEEIITGLSRVRSFFVITRNSSFTYNGRAFNVKQVGRELGVHTCWKVACGSLAAVCASPGSWLMRVQEPTSGHAVPKQYIESRIGINVDDAVATGDHIHGDGRGKIARRFGVALIAVGLILNGCAADPTPECAQASKDFEEALPSTSDVHLAPVDVLPAIVAGLALAVVERLPDDGQRQRCYDENHARQIL